MNTMESRVTKLNQQQSVYYVDSWQKLEKKLYTIVYDDFSAQRIFPKDAIADELDDSIGYYVGDAKATVVAINDYSQDLPSVSQNRQKFIAYLYEYGNSYQHSWKEIARGERSGTPLRMDDAKLCREAHEENINNIVWFGLASNNLVGLFTHPNISATGAVNGDWHNVATTAMEKYDDLNAGLNYMFTLTRDREKPDTVAMPLSKINNLRQTPMIIGTTAMGSSVHDYWLAHNGYVNKIVEARELLDVAEADNPYAGASGVETLMFYFRFDAEKGYIEITVPFKQWAPVVKSRSQSTDCTSMTGGFICRFPYAYLFVSGI